MTCEVQFKKYIFLSLVFLLPSLKSLSGSWGYFNNIRVAAFNQDKSYPENAKYSVDI